MALDTAHPRGAAARGGHHLRLQCRAHPLGGQGRPRRRPRAGGGRPRHVSRHRGGASHRLSRSRSCLPRGNGVRESAAAQGGGALHRQPRRAARRHGAHRAGRASQREARCGRPGDLLLAHHSRQREGRGARAERAGRPGRRGHHRPGRAGACLRPSAPRRARAALWLGEAEHRHSHAWRGPASRSACEARREARRQGGGAGAKRRHGAARCRGLPRSSTTCRSGGSTATARS